MDDKFQQLKLRINAENMTTEELAKKIGMNPSTFYRKAKSGVNAFTVGEMHSLVEVLNMTGEEAKNIFLS